MSEKKNNGPERKPGLSPEAEARIDKVAAKVAGGAAIGAQKIATGLKVALGKTVSLGDEVQSALKDIASYPSEKQAEYDTWLKDKEKRRAEGDFFEVNEDIKSFIEALKEADYSNLEARAMAYKLGQSKAAERNVQKAEWQQKADIATKSIEMYENGGDPDSDVPAIARIELKKYESLIAALSSLGQARHMKGCLQMKDELRFALTKAGVGEDKIKSFIDNLREEYGKLTDTIPEEAIFAAIAFAITKNPKIAGLAALKTTVFDKVVWPILKPVIKKMWNNRNKDS